MQNDLELEKGEENEEGKGKMEVETTEHKKQSELYQRVIYVKRMIFIICTFHV